MSLFNLAPVVNSFSATYTVTRRGIQTFTAGRASAAADSTFQAKLVIWSSPAKELARAKELYNAKGSISIVTTEAVTIGNESEPRKGDSVSFNNENYEIVEEQEYQHLGNFRQFLGVLRS